MTKTFRRSEGWNGIKAAIQQTWQGIAPDVIASCGEIEDLDELVEVTLDADRVETYGNLTDAAKAEYQAMDYEAKKAIAREALKKYVPH